MDTRSELRAGVLENARYDGPAGLVVFLVALPLCLGIALASGAPLFSGIIAGIVGGIVIGALSGSQVSVSGPAAGLAVIVATAIHDLGSFRVFLDAVVLSGVLQIAFGYLRAGVLANYVPNPVLKGMLAAIGLLIIFKQIPHALGRDYHYEGDFDFFFELDVASNTFSEIVTAIVTMHPVAVTISIVCLAILIVWDGYLRARARFFALVPAPLVAVVVGTIINEMVRVLAPGSHLLPEDGHVVSLPVATSVREFFANFTTPDWTALGNPKVWTTALVLAAVASIESLLSVEAIDKLDPFRRITPTNRELKAQGVGNLLSGLLGGLPITAVIVRGSANIYAGARTSASAVIHGLLLLVCVLLVPSLLNKIPLACLAAILLVIGYKLTKGGLYVGMYRAGLDQFLPFIVTVLAIVFTDLLTGIVIGMLVGLFFVIRTNHHAAMTLVHQDDFYLLRFNKDVSFVNKTELKEKLSMIPREATVFIDGANANFIDNDIYDVVADFVQAAHFRNITVEVKHFESKAQPYRRKGSDGKLQKAAARQ